MLYLCDLFRILVKAFVLVALLNPILPFGQPVLSVFSLIPVNIILANSIETRRLENEDNVEKQELVNLGVPYSFKMWCGLNDKQYILNSLKVAEVNGIYLEKIRCLFWCPKFTGEILSGLEEKFVYIVWCSLFWQAYFDITAAG